jgi:transcriptional regulator with XRE-family HTH domain
MNLESFGEELRKHREQRQISLASISEITRISEKMLESIEAGKFSVVPQAYIRAFLRAYARAIGLDGDETLRRYDAVNQEIRTAAEAWVNRGKSSPAKAERSVNDTVAKAPSVSVSSILIAVIALIAVAAVIYLANRSESLPTQEPLAKVPFDQAIRESEATVSQPESVLTPPPVVRSAAIDSLRLEMSTTDSIWLSMTIDATRRGEYLFPPGRVRTWAAKEQFVISMGNAAAATFRLNGKDLGALGKRGAVARNIVITQSGVQPTQ